MNYTFIVYNKQNQKKVGEVRTNHSISLDDAIELLDAERLEVVNSDDADLMIDGKEVWSDALDMMLEEDYLDSLSDEQLADIVGKADAWDKPGVMEAMNVICDRAGRKLRDMVESGQDCSEHFTALRGSAPTEFLEDTPNVSADQPDLIDWLRHGAEQAELEHLAYAVQDILGVSLM
jgi:hypothetical protein